MFTAAAFSICPTPSKLLVLALSLYSKHLTSFKSHKEASEYGRKYLLEVVRNLSSAKQVFFFFFPCSYKVCFYLCVDLSFCSKEHGVFLFGYEFLPVYFEEGALG